MKGLIFFDYDGTLVDERDEIYAPTAKTKEAITELQEEGYLCVLATGRPQSYIPHGAKNLHLDGYITSNGACVSVHGKEIFHDIFANEELSSLLQEFEEKGINFILENAKFCYVKDMKDPNYIHFLENFNTPKDNFVAYKGFEQVQNKIEKITLVFKDRIQLNDYRSKIEEQYAISAHRNCNTFDIAKKHIHKGVGVKVLCEHYHIDLKDTYAFGDGDNDVELLRDVGTGIAMGIHDEALTAVANYVTGTVKEEGIYKALKQLEVL